MKFVAQLFVLLLVFASPSRCAEIFASSIPGDGSERHFIVLRGEVIRGDFDRVLSAYNQHRANGNIVEFILLTSPGGSVDEAIKIGRFVRGKALLTRAPQAWGTPDDFWNFSRCGGVAWRDQVDRVTNEYGLKAYEDAKVDSDCTCASACALIWIGGLERAGDVGIHRSYFMSIPDETDFDTFSESIQGSHGKVVDYLQEMNVSRVVIEAFQNTSSSTLFQLSAIKDGLRRAGALDEYIQAKCREVPKLNLADTELYTKFSMIETLGWYIDGQDQKKFGKLSKKERKWYLAKREIAAARDACERNVVAEVREQKQQ